MVNLSTPSSTSTDFDTQLSDAYNTGLLYNKTSDSLADLTNPVAYTRASALSSSTVTTTATNSPINLVNPDGTYTVAGWTWNPSNAVIDGSIISGESAISTFASGFLESEGEPLAKQTVGSLLFNQSNGSLILGNSSSRSHIELTWGGQGLLNGLGNDFVVYENGDINEPEGYAVAVRIAGSDTFTPFRYEFYDTFEGQLTENPQAGVLATAFDLSDFGLANGQFIDAIQIINLQPDDLVNGQGQGFLGTSGVSPLDPTTGQPFAVGTLGRLDPDITFVAGLRDLQPVEPSVFRISATGDFNGDGQTDIVLRNRGTGQNFVWLMDGTEIASVAELRPLQDPNWDIRSAGDFNGDRETDLVLYNEVTGETSLWLLEGTNFVESVELTTVTDTTWNIYGTGDFNSDGETDILWRNQATGDNVVLFMEGIVEGFYAFSNPVEDPDWYIGGTGDFNSDGQVDVVWRNQATGENSVLLLNGIYLAVPSVSLPLWEDLNWTINGTGDFNGDGQVDILWQNETEGGIVAWLMDGTEVLEVSTIG